MLGPLILNFHFFNVIGNHCNKKVDACTTGFNCMSAARNGILNTFS